MPLAEFSSPPLGVILTVRPLTRPEADCLHHELKTTANILGYLPRELMGFGRGFVATDAESGALAGVCLWKDLPGKWTDLALLYVLPAYRGRGISRLLFEAAWNDIHAVRQRHVYVLSRSPQIIHLMQEKEMELARSAWIAPLVVHLHTQIHMSSWYRWKEAARKSALRKDDGLRFVAGTRRYRHGK